jgi:hypothetical protein
MARRTFVHIGLPKTGTTYLQTMMWRNRPQLQRQGLLYPGSKRLDHYHAQQAVRGGSAERMGDKADSWDRVRSELTAWEGDGLFTHEFLCLAKPRQIRRMLEALAPTEVHVVVTVRDHVRQFPALWQEALKMNYDGTLDEFVADALAGRRRGAWGYNSQDLPAILDRWSRRVPPERIHVITTPPPDAPRRLLWERWCQVLGIDDSGFVRDAGRPNESLGAAQAALMHDLKPFLTGDLNNGSVRHRWVRKYFGHEVLVPQRGARFGLRPEQAAQLRERSLAAVAHLEAGGYDIVGDVSDLVPGEPPPAVPHPDDVPAEERLEVAARAINQMIHDVRDLTRANERLEARLRNRPQPRSLLARAGDRLRRRGGRRGRTGRGARR